MENEYYGMPTTPTSDYLAHYGIKGMKWGVRKAIERGNQRALGRQYRKAQKKLAKLERQAANGKKYAKRAAKLGVGAAAAGGLAAAGTVGVGNAANWVGKQGSKGLRLLGRGASAAGTGIHKGLAAVGQGALGNRIHKGLDSAGRGLDYAAERTNAVGVKTGNAVKRWGAQTHDISGLTENVGKGIHQASARVGLGGVGNAAHKSLSNVKTVSNNTLARIGAGAVGAGLAGAAGYNAYRAATTKRAAKKAAQFRSEMNKAFAGTQYANGGAPRKKRRR